MTGFSAGIDSFCTVYDHLHRDIQDEYRITHFLFNNVGSHGDGEKGKELFNSRFNLIKGFCDEEAVPILKVNSNLNQILDLFSAYTCYKKCFCCFVASRTNWQILLCVNF